MHVAHVVFDGVVDIPSSKGFEVNEGKEDGKINSDAIADSYCKSRAKPETSFSGYLLVFWGLFFLMCGEC